MKLINKIKKGAISVVLIVLIAIVAIVGLIAMSAIGSYNGLVGKREVVATRRADIDTALQSRADLIPNLVSTVKGYMNHEDAIIDKITNARQNLLNANSLEEKSAANNELTSGINALMVIVENYPDLKSSQNFINLQDELAASETKIANARREYNEAVSGYNTSIQTFPNNVLAGMFNFEKAEYFEADESAQTVPVVDFSE